MAGQRTAVFLIRASAALRRWAMKIQNAAKEAKTARGSSRARALPAPAVMVLHIDDDPNDAALLRAAVSKAATPFQIRNVEDAEQAIAYLSGGGKYADRQHYPSPALVLLDLKMPRTTGLEVLQWIRSHPELAHLPVVVLSGSELHDDIQRAYSAGANSYLVKPLGFEALVTMVKNLQTTWLPSISSAPVQANQPAA